MSIQNFNTNGTYSIGKDGGYNWHRTQDGHGGHGAAHRAEMEQIAAQIAQQKIAEAIPAIQQSAYASAYSGLLNALSFDVTSAVTIGMENCGTIFYDSMTQNVIAKAVMREIKKHWGQGQ